MTPESVEETLKEIVQRIFGLQKTTFDSPATEAKEQEGCFIEVEDPHVRIRDKVMIARVTGTIRLFINADKMPFDYIAKCIKAASLEDLGKLCFYDVGLSRGRFMNIDERSIRFVYFYRGQYDPNQGSLTSVNINVTVGEQ